jgi:DNA-binding NtrC family response regulator
MSERDIFYKVLFELRKDLSDLKGVVFEMMQNGKSSMSAEDFGMKQNENMNSIFSPGMYQNSSSQPHNTHTNHANNQGFSKPNIIDIPVIQNPEPESLSIEHKEIELIKKALDKYRGRRKKAANELGISERTLYRKIKQYDLED